MLGKPICSMILGSLGARIPRYSAADHDGRRVLARSLFLGLLKKAPGCDALLILPAEISSQVIIIIIGRKEGREDLEPCD
jgi:hypothetical protein